MTTDPKSEAALALHRFGLGPRIGSIVATAADPLGALLAELDQSGAGNPISGSLSLGHLHSSGEVARAAFKVREARRIERLAERARREAAKAANAGSDAPATGSAVRQNPANAGQPNPPQVNPVFAAQQQAYRDEARFRIGAALNSEIGLVERLTWFWSNHFCVSIAKNGVRPLAGAYEREAIRPHVLGRFADMLLAAETHPAMLIYLDNARSIGPNSQVGLDRGRGLNENLAREILELHTLGVRTVYTQDDVTRFAKVLTGWTIVPAREENGGEFAFNPRMHEPGPQTIIDGTLPEGGLDQGRAVLAMLARHPATAHHIATKLVRHFISDAPIPALADRLAERFLETDGDLKEVTKTLIVAPEAWNMADRKLKRPSEWIVAALRATGTTAPDVGQVLEAQSLLGEPLWRPAAPKGFPDEDAAWIDGLAQRLDVANQLARRVADMTDPELAVETTLGPLATSETRTAIRRAESRPQALTLLFMAPEFQRS